MEWISIKDKLPLIGQVCLLFRTYPKNTRFNCRADPLDTKFMLMGGRRWNGDFISIENQNSNEALKYVSHWAPLPEPPEDK